MRTGILALFTAISLGFSSPVLVQAAEPPQPPSLMALATEARAARLAGNHRAWLDAGTRTLALAPDHPDLLISVSRAHAALGNRTEALAMLDAAVTRGAGLDPERLAEFSSLRTDSEFRAIAARARANLAPVARATPFAILPADAEGIAYDPRSRRLFVGTGDGVLLQIDPAGRVTSFVSGNGLQQILGLKVDAQRRLLWAVTGRFPDPVPEGEQPLEGYGVSGIYAFNLETGERIGAYVLDERPTLHGLNDMALARDGTIYVTDSPTGSIYVLPPGASALRLLTRDPAMSYPNGIQLSPD
jgi:hypothetical protein